MQIISFANCHLGPLGLTTLAKFIPDIAALTAVNVMKNPIGDDGLAKLMSAIEGTSVKTISGMMEGQTSLDWSNQNLTPMDLKILATDISFSSFTPRGPP